MQPMGGEEQKKQESPAKNVLGGAGLGSANSAATNGAMNFNFTPFGQTTNQQQRNNNAAIGGTPLGGTPVKRTSIDESWVNVDWSEVARKSQQNSPPKSPKIDHPMASVLHPPSDIESGRVNKPSEGLESSFSPSHREQNKPATTTPSFGSSHFGEHKETFSKPTTAGVSSPFNLPKSSTIDEIPKGAAPKSPVMKPVTPSREPAPTLPPTISSASKSTGFTASTAVPVKAESIAKPNHSQEAAYKPTPTKGEYSFKPSSAKTEEPHKSVTTPKVAEASKVVASAAGNGNGKQASVGTTPKVSAPATATAKDEVQASNSAKVTPKAKTPRKSVTTTPTTPRSSGRSRKTVDRLSPGTIDISHEPKAIEIPQGNGAKFADIAHSALPSYGYFILLTASVVSKELAKRKADFQPVITLHRALFGRPGEASKRKSNLRGFNGLASEDDMQKIAEKLGHYTADELRDICGLLNLEHSGEKKTLADRIAKYLLKPSDLGESKPTPRRTTPQKRSKKSSPASAKKGKKGKTMAGKEIKKAEDEEAVESGSESDDDVIADLEEGQADAN